MPERTCMNEDVFGGCKFRSDLSQVLVYEILRGISSTDIFMSLNQYHFHQRQRGRQPAAALRQRREDAERGMR